MGDSMYREAVNVIRATETRLQEMMSEAVRQGLYAELRAIAELAQRLSALVSESQSIRDDKNATSSEGTAGWPDLQSNLHQSPQPSGQEVAITTESEKDERPTKRKRRITYPRFFREGDFLLKVGWSKTGRCEYEHKAHCTVLRKLAQALEAANDGNAAISTETLFPLKTDSGDQIPSYQAYLCLAWLKEKGLVRQLGRKGYFVSGSGSLPRMTEEAWDQLGAKKS